MLIGCRKYHQIWRLKCAYSDANRIQNAIQWRERVCVCVSAWWWWKNHMCYFSRLSMEKKSNQCVYGVCVCVCMCHLVTFLFFPFITLCCDCNLCAFNSTICNFYSVWLACVCLSIWMALITSKKKKNDLRLNPLDCTCERAVRRNCVIFQTSCLIFCYYLLLLYICDVVCWWWDLSICFCRR